MKRILLRAAGCGFLLAALAGLFPFAAASEILPEHIVRLHVVAHSDDPRDQAVKLKVRDAVLAEARRWVGDAADQPEASAVLCLHLDSLRAAADQVLTAEGIPQRAAVQVTDGWFPTRAYGGFTLPAGVYRTLRVTIGEGRGHNWWCVVFPALCLPAAGEEEDPLALLPEGPRGVVEDPQVTIKFKAVEIYEKLKKLLTPNS